MLERLAQKKALDRFIDKWFLDEQGSFKAASHEFEKPAQFEELVDGHLRKLIGSRLVIQAEASPAQSLAPIWKKGSPFRGLETFEAEHAPIFCGRTAAASEALERLRIQAQHGNPFLLLTGPSGCGKSSLARAGILPALTCSGVIEGVGLWRRASFRPTDADGDLLEGLAQALLQESALPEIAAGGTDATDLAKLLRDSPKAVAPLIKSALTQAANEVQREEKLPEAPRARIALLLDQLEELFTAERVTPERRQALGEALLALVTSGRVWVVATLRSDFYPQLSELDPFLQMKGASGQLDLQPPTPHEIGQMIRQPARMAGLRFDEDPQTDASLDELLRDAAAADPEALPLLEFALEELYKRCSDSGLLSMQSYETLGGLEGALATRAEEVYASLDAQGKQTLPAILGALVNLGLGEVHLVARRKADLEPLAADPARKAVIDAFVQARLFVTSVDGEKPVLSVAHEALLHHWPRAAGWIEENDEALHARARIAAGAAIWQEEERAQDYLLPPGPSLVEAKAIAGDPASGLGRVETEFVEASFKRGRSRRRRRLAISGAVVVLALAAVAATLWYRDAYVSTHTEYFATYITRWSVPEGLRQVTEEQQKRRAETYRFYRRGQLGKVFRVECINGWGDLVPPTAGAEFMALTQESEEHRSECAFEFKYDEDGNLVHTAASDRRGRSVYVLSFPPATGRQKVVRAGFKNPNWLPTPRAPSGASLVEYTRSDDGLDIQVRYLDSRGNTVPDAEGSHGFRSTFNADGSRQEATNLGADGTPTPMQYGVVSLTTTEGPWGFTEAQLFGRNQEPVVHPDFGHRPTVGYDEVGNIIEIALFDTKGRLLLSSHGFARAELSHDERGNVISRKLYGAENKPILVLIRARFERGTQVEERYEHVDGTPALNNGVASARFQVDGDGNRVRETYFGPDGKRTRDLNWVAEARSTYDDQGNRTGQSFFGADGKPTLCKDGYSRIAMKYEQGRLVEQTHYDTQGRETLDKQGVFRLRMEYDSSGNETARAFFDVDGNPTLNSDGYARVEEIYDVGNPIEESYLGIAGKPTLTNGGFASVTRKYRWGSVIEQDHFDTEGNKTLTAEGIFQVRTDYDEIGRVVKVRYFGLDGKRTLNQTGICELRSVFDKRGLEVTREMFGIDSKRALNGEGYATQTLEYDARGNTIAESYFDVDGNRTLTTGGYSRMTGTYDERGNAEEVAFFGNNGERAISAMFGCVRVGFRYDDRDLMTGLVQYGPDDAILQRIRGEHDERGNEIEYTFFGPGDVPIAPAGHHRSTARYDARDRTTEQVLFGLDGSTLIRTVMGHDARGNQIDESYFGPDGTPIAPEGPHRITARYDARNRLIAQVRFALDNSTMKQTYDGRGNKIEQGFFGPGDKPIAPGEFHRFTAQYDAHAIVIEANFFDADGKPTPVWNNEVAHGFHRFTTHADELGNMREKRLFDSNFRVHLKFDEHARITEEIWHDAEGKPTMGVHGYARKTSEPIEGTPFFKSTCWSLDGAKLPYWLRVEQIDPQGQAARIDLRPGDVLLTYGGVRLDEAPLQLLTSQADGPRKLELLRGGNKLTLEVQPGTVGVLTQVVAIPELPHKR